MIPLDRDAVATLRTTQLITSVGDGGYYTTSALFFTVALGIPVWQVAVGLTVAWSFGLAASVPLGSLVDRIGVRRTSAMFAAAGAFAIAAYPALLLLPRATLPLPALVVAIVYSVAQSALGATRQAAVAVLVPADDRTRVRASMQVLGNAGIGAGAVVGAAALAVGSTRAFVTVLLVDALAFGIGAVLLARLSEPPRPPASPVGRGDAQPAGAAGLRRVLRQPGLLPAATLNGVLLLYMPLLSVVLPIWVESRTDAPPVVSAVGFLLNTIGVALLQGRASRRVVDVASAVRSFRTGGLLLGLAAIALGSAALVSGPVAATLAVLAGVAVQTVAEVLFAAGSWAIGFALSPVGAEGAGQAVWGAGVSAARAAGPVLLAGAMIAAGPVGWLVAGAVFSGAGIAMGPLLGRGRGVLARTRER